MTDLIPGTWVDSDYTDGTVSAAMKFRTSAYGENVQDTVGNNDHCAFTIFGKDDGSIAGKSNRCSSPLSMRADDTQQDNLPNDPTSTVLNGLSTASSLLIFQVSLQKSFATPTHPGVLTSSAPMDTSVK
jgi:hypothetical protein